MKFRRRKNEPQEETERSTVEGSDPATGSDADAEQPATDAAGPDLRAEGPWDRAEVELDEDDPNKIDLGGLVITGRPGMELRLQIDEGTQQIAAVLLVGGDGAVELRPFAAPRNGDIWEDVRGAITAETTRRGGTVSEADGVYGKELRVVVPVTTPDGTSATQPSRVFGISGPRWLLRATFLGQPALEPKHDGLLESALRDVIVVRGNDPMAPGDPIPIVMPANAQRLE